MLHFSNQELAETHHVSVRTVRNWIEAAREGKLDLTLHTIGQRDYIANTSKNSFVISDLVTKGKKYRPHRSQKIVSPTSEFYDMYSQEQLYDIVSNMEINHEIPNQYNYFGRGAAYWDEYTNHLASDSALNALTATVDLFKINHSYIDSMLEDYEVVNVVDVGPGNCLPVKEFLQHLLDSGKMGRYIAVDISDKMLKIATDNLTEWFGDKLKVETHTLDILHDRFGTFLANEYIKDNSDNTRNIVLFLGGTIGNFRRADNALTNIHDSLGINDLYIQQQKLDTRTSRQYFDFNPDPSDTTLAPTDRYVFDLLNIDKSLYEADMGFDPIKCERYIRIKLNISLSIKFQFENGERSLHFNKGDTILAWRFSQHTLTGVVDQLLESDIVPIQTSQTEDQEYIMTISKIKHD